jgi:molecular chaperone GrpE
VTQGDPHDEPVIITDKRRIDPDTGEVREGAFGGQERTDPRFSSGSAPSGSAPGGPAAKVDEAEELKSTLQRVKAEYDNYRKRSVRQEQAAADRAKAVVVMQLLPVLDDLDRARSHGDLESGPLKSVADKLAAALEGIGVVAFGAEGDAFDPERHEAVQHEGDGSNPVVGTVMRQGYLLGDRVLRHAMVGVVDSVEETDTNGDVGRDDDVGGDDEPESNE